MATPFGKAVRKLRIDRGLKLKDMADSLNMKSAYLSAVETGKKRITDNFFAQVAEYFADESIERQLHELVAQSQPECNIDLRGKTDRERELVTAFARRFSDLSDDKKQSIEELLMEV